jgi:hypothetical protein
VSILKTDVEGCLTSTKKSLTNLLMSLKAEKRFLPRFNTSEEKEYFSLFTQRKGKHS